MSDTIPTQPRPKWVATVPDPAYWEALGRFVEQFAITELMVVLFLGQYAGIAHTMARAVFSGTRADAAIGLIRRAMDVSPRPIEIMHEIDDVLSQMRTISNVRNEVVHFASFVTSDKGRVVSNVARAHIPERVKERRVSPQMLDDMTSDLEKIGLHFVTLLPAFSRSSHPLPSLADRAAELPALGSAWRYNPPPEPQKK